MKHLLLFTLPLLLLAACGGTHNLLDQEPRRMKYQSLYLDSAFMFNPDYQYRLKEDDKVTISLWGQDEFSVGSTYGIYNANEVYGRYLMVDYNGNIEVPKVGTLNVDSMTIIELKDTLRKAYANWVIDPIVDVKILNRDITMLGEVRNPGVYDVDKNHNSLFKMLAMSGGLQDYANLKYVKVFRQEGQNVRVATINLKQSKNYLTQNIQLLPGDIVVVPSKSYKEFDKRISVIIPFTSAITAAAIFRSAF